MKIPPLLVRPCHWLSFVLGVSCLTSSTEAQPNTVVYETQTDIPYAANESSDDYQKERCRLDVYYPKSDEADRGISNEASTPTVVWFHGGGLRGGNKSIPDKLKNQGIIVVAVNYRLFPKARCPEYIEDAAAAVAWTFQNIEEYGGSPDKIYVSGHSAGGYLTSMIGLDKSYLAKHGIDANRIAGLIPFSGHTITHFTPREEQGIPDTQPVVDRFAPLYHVRPDAPPLILITGDRELEMLGRYEENAYLARMMKVVKHPSTKLYELDGFDHGGMADPAFMILLKHIRAEKKAAASPTTTPSL